MVKISDIINYLEYSFTDISAQSKWDFSGKQIYTGDREISKIALSLDAKEDIIEKAVKEQKIFKIENVYHIGLYLMKKGAENFCSLKLIYSFRDSVLW